MCKIFLTFFWVFLVVNVVRNVISQEEEQNVNEQCPQIPIQLAHIYRLSAGVNFSLPCIQENINLPLLESELKEAKTLENYEDIFRRLCLQENAVYSCMDEKINTIHECSTNQSIIEQQSVSNFVKRLLSQVCYEEGNLMARIVSTNDHLCAYQKKSAIGECALKVFENPAILSRTTKEELCGDFTEMMVCAFKILKQCENSDAANFVKGVHVICLEELGCDTQVLIGTEVQEVQADLDGEATQPNNNVTTKV